jgi:hypothetical protein
MTRVIGSWMQPEYRGGALTEQEFEKKNGGRLQPIMFPHQGVPSIGGTHAIGFGGIPLDDPEAWEAYMELGPGVTAKNRDHYGFFLPHRGKIDDPFEY